MYPNDFIVSYFLWLNFILQAKKFGCCTDMVQLVTKGWCFYNFLKRFICLCLIVYIDVKQPKMDI